MFSLLGFMKFLADYRLPLPPSLVLGAFAVNEYFPKAKRKTKSEKRKTERKTCIFNSLRNLQRRPRRRGRESLTRIKGKQMRGPAEWTEGERSGKGEEGGGERGIILTVSINQILLNLLKFAYKE